MRPLLQKAWLVLRTALLINAGFLALLLIGLALLTYTPAYRLAQPNFGVPDWKAKTKHISDQEVLARLEQAVKMATADGSYWDTVRTAEEQYPGLYSPGYPPPYWNKIERDLELGRALGLVRSESLPPYESLTRRERLFLCHFVGERHVLDLVDRLQWKSGLRFMGASEHLNEWLPERTGRSDLLTLHEYYGVSADGPSVEQAKMWLENLGPRYLFSPLAPGFVRLDCTEFAAGQAYVECYFQDDEWKRLLPLYMQLTAMYSPQDCRDHGLVYYRVYGEKSVIAEGVRTFEWAGRKSRLRSKFEELGMEGLP